ncbi:Berberine/berberine-like protein [Cynara cardunculus var. scolymus]|uniref:Berberine/berberine-like protein n=1 Tax=Cynara cardunculus var. scolymus TaxID=59895 RepID=A0A103YAB2_CYNCS|nr:Berberine/berberine-like protein [Cynara cardunculus var. scolymus]
MKSSIMLSLLLSLLLFSFSNAAMDPDSVYQSFLQCLPSQSPESDHNLSSILYSSTANSSSYTAVLQAYIKNNRFNTTATPKPSIIITPTTESQVQAAVLCAKKIGVQIKIRSGGHDYEGISYVSSEPDFIILDMFNFRSIDVNIADESAVVGAGAQLGELFYRISEKSKVHGFPAGVCPTVGVGGHLSGGGYGTMLRKYGLSVDHVTDARIVDVNGRILDRKSMGEDLFWAIRGGGGGSFGVILSYTVKLVPVPEVNTVFRILKTVAENATELVYKWQTVVPNIDDDLFVRVLLQPVTVNRRRTGRATFIAHFLGDSDRLVALMNKNFPELGLRKEDCIEVSWIESVLYWANFDLNTTAPEILLDRHSDNVNYGKRKSDYVQTPISESGLKSIFDKLVELGKVGFVFNPYGGKMYEIPADATPFPHRAGNLFKIQYSVNWNDPDPELEANYLNQSRVMYEFMTPFVSKNPRGAFLNYRDLDIGVTSGDGKNSYSEGVVYGEKYFMGNFERLVKIKTEVDPDNFFRNEQSIPTLAGKSSGKSRKMMK